MFNNNTFPRSDNIHIDNLLFDPLNPRIPSNLDGENEKDVLKWMLDDAGILDLMMSIAEQGYFGGEPLLVVPSNESGKYIVVEGNRRLAVLKLLNNPKLAESRQGSVQNIIQEAKKIPPIVPVIIYEKREDVLDYLGFRHVTGIKSWGPLAKARYLSELSRKYNDVDEREKYKLLAKTIGTRIDYVRRMLAGLRLYDVIEDNNFYGISNLNEDTISFSLITTALANNNIVSFLGLENAQDLDQEDLDKVHLQELTNWIFKEDDSGKTKLGESRNFRHLNKIVANEVALKEFREGRTLEEALLFTDTPIETFRSLLLEAKQRLQDADRQFYLVREGFNEEDTKPLEDINVLVDDMLAVLRQRIKRSLRDV